MEKRLITENDKIYNIVKQYPQLLDVILELSPKFEKLKNPVLFNTVAKVTTVKKAAEVGKVYLREFLWRLNDAIGLGDEFLAQQKKEIMSKRDDFLKQYFKLENNSTPPEWLEKINYRWKLDVRDMAEDPFSYIIEHAGKVATGEGFILIQRFEPIPLMTYLKNQGFESYSEEKGKDEVWVYFYKKEV